MSAFLMTRRARVDLQMIWNHIAEDSFDAADQVIADLYAAMHKIAKLPILGHVRADVDDEKYLFFVVHRYVIAYVRDASPLRIERIIHGSRDFRQIFF